MKPLKNQVLIYDKDCPMCCVYTSAFIKANVLDKDGRTAFNDKLYAENPNFNPERAQNEIALVNRATGEVKYGIESMFEVIGHAAPILKPLFKFKPFKWFMKKVYSFISYNRKVIAPPPKNPADIQCIPDVNMKYRWLYICFAVVMAGVISGIGLAPVYGEEALVFGSLAVTGIIVVRLLIQAFLVKKLATNPRVMDYIGNLVTVNLQLAVLVALLFGFTRQLHEFGLSDTHGQVYLVVISALAIRMHMKRLKSLNMNRWFCLAWNLQWIVLPTLTVFICQLIEQLVW